MRSAWELKEEGNRAFRAGKLEEAVSLYTEAIEKEPGNHLLHGNRSIAEGARGRWTEAERDAAESIRLCPGFVRGYYRLAKAQLQLEKLREALATARKGNEIAVDAAESTGLSSAQEGINELSKLEAAIAARLGDSPPPPPPSGIDASACAGSGAEGDAGGQGLSPQPPNPFAKDKISPKDFKSLEELGTGNFSTIHLVKHLSTGKKYALKVIEKEEANRVRKRHPNVYNEIYMEKRALTKLHGHPAIVDMYATFQDYSCLYFLLELCHAGEIWDALLHEGKPVGAHPSLAQFWMSELLLGVEHIHSHGMVHRDIKPENLMLTEAGHLKIIDFGTCKDLVETDLNGPEFVGTAQYMSPQAVNSEAQGKEADLWAMGCCLYQFLCGTTPFHSPSPYLCFLRIRSGNILYPKVIGDEAKNLVQRLVQRVPSERLGSDGMASLKAHSYFRGIDFNGIFDRPAVRVPRLLELCVRAAAKHIASYAMAQPFVRGDLPAHADLLRAESSGVFPTRAGPAIRHFLHRTGLLANPKVSRALSASLSDSRCLRADAITREYVGLDWDSHGHWKEPFFFVHLTDPQLGLKVHGIPGDEGLGEGEFELEADRLRQCVTAINQMRPRFVIVTGDLTQSRPYTPAYEPQVTEFRRIMSRVSETIPVLFAPGNHDVGHPFSPENFAAYESRYGADYYGFWWGGVRGIVLNSSLLIDPSSDRERYEAQEKWADAELSIAQLNAHHVLVFMHHPLYESDPKEEPEEVYFPIPVEERLRWLAKFARCKVRVVFAGHLHRNLTHRIKRVAISETVRNMGLLVPEKDLYKSSDRDDEDDGEDDWKVEDVDMELVVTGSPGGAVPGAKEGLRVVKVYRDTIDHEFFTLDDLPSRVRVEPEKE